MKQQKLSKTNQQTLICQQIKNTPIIKMFSKRKTSTPEGLIISQTLISHRSTYPRGVIVVFPA